MNERRRGNGWWNYFWGYLARRRAYVAIAGVLAVLTALLLVAAAGSADYGRNLALNLGADLIGTIVVLFLIAPMIERGDRGRDSVLDRFDHKAFIRQAGDARHRIMVLELWLDLLQGTYRKPFADALRGALKRDVELRILLLDPDAAAARQRADDLGRTNVNTNILENLQRLHEFRQSLPERLRGNIDIRVYAALPPVQMYRVDDRLIVSFFPVNMTSWNAAQYQTNPQAQLGTFVCAKFDELWDAENTRTLEQFRRVDVEVGFGAEMDSYQVRFVTDGEHTYLGGRDIVDAHANTGIAGLHARLVRGNAQGERDVLTADALTLLEAGDPDHHDVQTLFERKYGHNHEVVLKFVPGEP
ncbi:hypothetical protein [Amycolatopsis sp. H20-H5]|uniref:hypothetical protein n=1 Tax=Amycolatopsis sp. H20-H5 TaxID=3046309 RepID=UPI002DBF150E|nr:hypothetical protein [Amycolatopsis sp. H20-H5]MEC3981218.1 hypothetical protein [Amycolatopsis sp. H20-H5]